MSNNNSSLDLLVDPYDWRYAESPDIPESVYIAATVYMVIVGSFGIISNSAIIVAFFKGNAQVSRLFKLYLNNASNFQLLDAMLFSIRFQVYKIPTFNYRHRMYLGLGFQKTYKRRLVRPQVFL